MNLNQVTIPSLDVTASIAFYKKLDFQFHSTTRLDAPSFREELRGMDRMFLILDT